MYNFNAASVDCSYVFRLLQSNPHQSVYQKYKNGIILYQGNGLAETWSCNLQLLR
jgi:hypothetical protein